MNIEKLKQIKIGYPFRVGSYIIDRYLTGTGLGWIVQSPEGGTFISRDPEKVLKHISTQDEIEDLGSF
jgi:hypothetical protein